MSDENVITTPGKRPPGRPKGSRTKAKPIGAGRAMRRGDRVSVELVVPLDPLPDVPFHARGVSISRLTLEQAETMSQIVAALNAEHARLATGRHVETACDVVRWFLDEVRHQNNG